MKRYQFNKLIRSKIPLRMKSEGITINSNSLSRSDYLIALKKKIVEEAYEVYHASSKDNLKTELADIIEVIHTIAQANQISLEEIEKTRIEKREINGFFSPKNYINYIECSKDNHRLITYLENKNRSYKFKN